MHPTNEENTSSSPATFFFFFHPVISSTRQSAALGISIQRGAYVYDVWIYLNPMEVVRS